MMCFRQSVCVLIVMTVVGKVLGGAGWEYKGDLGPLEWHKHFVHCGGRMQSPINVETNRVLFDPVLQSFDLSEYSNTEGFTMKLENVKGHTVEVVYGGSPITIRGGSLPDEYVLDQFHFHWGAHNDKGSEHTLDHRVQPMEMHIVHHMSSLNASESAVTPYGLAVLGFFIQIGEHNPGFDALLSNFPDVIHKGAEKVIAPFSLSDLLAGTWNSSDSGYYYRYFGSLTTPPCYETVIWSLFKDKITISQQQLDTFRTLRTQREGEPTESVISDDYRPLQPIHERSVISNDPTLLHDSASIVVTRLEQDIRQLKKACSTGGGGRAGPILVGGLPAAPWLAALVWFVGDLLLRSG